MCSNVRVNLNCTVLYRYEEFRLVLQRLQPVMQEIVLFYGIILVLIHIYSVAKHTTSHVQVDICVPDSTVM